MRKMKGPMFSVLSKPSIAPTEIYAARRAMNSLAKYNVQFDVRLIGEGAVEKMKMGAQLLKALTTRGPLHLDSSVFLMADVPDQSLWDSVGSIGIGLTEERVFVSTNVGLDAREHEVMDASRYRRGSLVSVSGLRKAFGFDTETGRYKDEQAVMRAMELAVLRAAGHVLIEADGLNARGSMGERHCPNSSCLLQESSGLEDFLGRIVNAGFRFCRACEYRIRAGLRDLRPV